MIAAACLFLLSSQTDLAAFLEKQPTPEAYVLEKTRKHRVVFLGEDHGIKQNLDFAARLIPQLAAAGVMNFGMEFGAEEDQAALDALTTAPTYDESKARDIMFHYNVGWPYLEYREIYRTAWTVNRNRKPGSPPFRIINLSYVYDWSAYSGRYPASIEKVFHRGPIEAFRRDIVRKEILSKGQRIVILTGTPHAFTKFTNPVFDHNADRYVHFDDRDFGNLVQQAAPKETFTILLNQAFWSANPPGKNVYPAEGALDRAFKRPVGFDLAGTPAGDLADQSWYSLGRPNFRMQDLSDGFILLAPIKDLRGCTIDRSFVTDATLPEVLKNWPDPDWHVAPKTLDAYYQVATDYMDLNKRYQSLPPSP